MKERSTRNKQTIDKQPKKQEEKQLERKQSSVNVTYKINEMR